MAEITTLHARLDLGGVTGASRPAIDQPWTAAGGYGRIRVGIGWVATRDYALCSTHPMTEIATLHAPLDLGGVTGASPPALDRPWTAAGGYKRHRVAIGEPPSTHPRPRRGHFSGPSALAACLGL